MSLEQTDFFDKLDNKPESGKDNSSDKKEEKDQEVGSPSKNLKPDDGLSFNCEICQDAPGGCPSCGFGRDQ